MGERKLDVLILTHYHSDHANGVLELLERLEVETLVVPDVEPESVLRQTILKDASKQGTAVMYITNRYTFSMGQAVFTVYPPMGEDDANEECLSVLATEGSFDVLMTGDMGDSSEERLVQQGSLPDIELLVVGHHGSKYSTSEKLLDAVTPETAVISVGYNSYGHPTEEILDRLEKNKIQIYRTDTAGTVTVKLQEGSE
ncbi:ComE operon protein 3 [bioreactor metagenome]|uniref:ComE operon protein 3 n=1 Tax=bioreactor metagenome TaxID=1076179 RepID=A0A645F5W4_9ZZZZ